MRDRLIRLSLSNLGPGPNLIRSYLSNLNSSNKTPFVIYLTLCSKNKRSIEHHVNKLDQFFNMVFYIKSFLEHRLNKLDQYLKSLDKLKKFVYNYIIQTKGVSGTSPEQRNNSKASLPSFMKITPQENELAGFLLSIQLLFCHK
jgi:hypothetical protein